MSDKDEIIMTPRMAYVFIPAANAFFWYWFIAIAVGLPTPTWVIPASMAVTTICLFVTMRKNIG